MGGLTLTAMETGVAINATLLGQTLVTGLISTISLFAKIAETRSIPFRFVVKNVTVLQND
jgi:hypothetical protein